MNEVAWHDERLGRRRDSAARRRLHGVLLREWWAHRDRLLGFIAAWLVCQFLILAFFHPGFLLAFGVIFAFAIAPVFGGLDVTEGSEEFSFSLPPTRGELYLVRFFTAGGLLALLLLAGLAAIRFDVPQKLWGLVVETGFTEPFPLPKERNWTAITLVVPLALFALTFLAASAGRTRNAVGGAWLFAILAGGILAGTGQAAEWLLLQQSTGRFALAALGAGGVAAALLGYGIFTWKEGVSRPQETEHRGSVLGWAIAIFAVLLVAMAVLFLFVGSRTKMQEATPVPQSTDLGE